MAAYSLRQQWFLLLQFRPLIWLTFFAAGGAATGMRGALSLSQHASTPPVRNSSLLFAALVFFTFFVALAYFSKTQTLLSRICAGLAVACIFCGYAAHRVLPPRDDISRLTWIEEKSEAKLGPIVRPEVTVRGWIADSPRRSEMSTQFPLECAEVGDASHRKTAHGQLWLSLPPMPALQNAFGRELEVGDAIQVEAQLSSLDQPTNPGQRDRSFNRILDECWAQGRVRAPAGVRLLRSPPRFALERKIGKLRQTLLSHYENSFEKIGVPYPRAVAQLLTAMAFGEGGLSSPLPRQVRDDFRAAGMSHILVASGTQISFLALMIFGASRVLGLRRWPLLLVLIPVLFSYALLAGSGASIWRAAIAGVCVALALLQGRDVDALNLWALAFLILLLLDPAQLFDIGFQLSFAATWGLIVLGPALRQLFKRTFGENFLTLGAAFSLAAQAGVAPIAAYHFGKFSLAGLGANLIGIPLAGVLVGTGLANLLLPIAPLHQLNYFLSNAIANTASYAANLPGASFERPPLRLLWTVFIYGALLVSLAIFQYDKRGAFFSRQNFLDNIWLPLRGEVHSWWQRSGWHRRPQSFWKFPAAILLLAVLLMAWRTWQSTQVAPLRVAMLDVKQGESIVVQSPAGRTVLIDGGGLAQWEREDVGRNIIVPYLQAAGIKKLDAMVITHADADHCNGLASVVREIPVGMVLDGAQGGNVTAIEYLELRRLLEQRNIAVIPARAGQTINLGSGARLRVLAPMAPVFRNESADNNNAAVLRLEYGTTSVMLTGDIERAAEERLVRRGAKLRCTVLKVAHHGSKTSTSELFLRAALPHAAIISSGRYNQFGHPNGEVLARLAKKRVRTFRTDLHGAIEVSCDGRECWIQTQR